MKNLYSMEDDQSAILQALKKFKKESERMAILWSAMNYLKHNPKDSIKIALEYAEVEWMEANEKD